MTKSGTSATLFGFPAGTNINDTSAHFWPTADYLIDGVSCKLFNRNPPQSATYHLITAGPQTPYLNDHSQLIYMTTPLLADGNHMINVTVTAANETNLYTVEYFEVATGADTVSSTVSTALIVPTITTTVITATTLSTRTSSSVGAAIGGAIGGIVAGVVIAVILAIVIYHSLKRKPRGEPANTSRVRRRPG